MKVVMTLVARDEADVVDDQIRYHLNAGVDFVIATDHRSVDGTNEILRRHEREGHLRLIRETEVGFFQSAWVTSMARLAAVEHDADWVINSDADEFWWPRQGSIREVLAAVPPRYGVIRGLWRHFVLRPETGAPFYERMVVRRRPSSDPSDPYHAQVKVAHRADRSVVVTEGNHDARSDRLMLIREWFPFEVLHFPTRSRNQLGRKYVGGWEGHRVAADSHPPRHIQATAEDISRRSLDTVYAGFLVDDAALDRGLEEGTMMTDTRLRDALRPRGRPPQEPPVANDVEILEEIDLVLETDAARHVWRRVGRLERRIRALESTAILRERIRRPTRAAP